ncbi:hypothetical protein [Geoglobus acetivorans]|uniref:Uncharacterized protein n=1 Tax=Geoglobus acetivorans TaxID=565033 RepID=A0A0A7GJD8_GEOAI|nr:hypothetical protein GACE_2012 [Geoglobus acetivorans]
MVKTVTIQLPDWIDEERLGKAIAQAISKITSAKEVSVDELGEILGVKPEDLTEEIDVENIVELRKNGKD